MGKKRKQKGRKGSKKKRAYGPEKPVLKKKHSTPLRYQFRYNNAKTSDFEVMCRRFEYDTTFHPQSIEVARHYADESCFEHSQGRVDYRGDRVITIDGEDAKDFDDAISLKKVRGLYKLNVHVADVSYFVPEDSRLDKEARFKGTSVYLLDRVLPMLPEVLSNQLCSLVEGRDRFTLSCEIVIDKQGKIRSYSFHRGVIHSHRRCTYKEVQAVLDGDLDLGKELNDDLKLMHELKVILLKKRIAEGSIDLDSSELQFELNEQSEIVGVHPRKRLSSERIIEEFMLRANICAAKYLQLNNTGVFRVHESPDEDRLKDFRNYVQARGYELPQTGNENPLTQTGRNRYDLFLSTLEDTDERKLFSMLLLTRMKQARYVETNLGHYGLAFPAYTHFTSPIRRYPDLMVHRMIQALIKEKKPIYNQKRRREYSFMSSALERKAVDAEREYKKVKSIRFLEKRLGESFDCSITGLAEHRIFVRILEYGIEGMVDLKFLGLQGMMEGEVLWLRHDEGLFRFHPGMHLKAQLSSVNIQRLFIDFIPVWEDLSPQSEAD